MIIMWIKCVGDTKSLFLRDKMDEPLEFSSNGTTQVPQELGEYLVEHYPKIKEHSTQTAEVKTAEEPEDTDQELEVGNDG